jgi:hypothetical protein
MAASNRQMNWSGGSFTPTGVSAIALTGVTNCRYDDGGTIDSAAGDADLFPTTIVHNFSAPTFTLDLLNINKLNSLRGLRGSFTIAHNDAKTGATNKIVYTVSDPLAVVVNVSHGGAHRQIGSGSISIACESSDGATHPVALS